MKNVKTSGIHFPHMIQCVLIIFASLLLGCSQSITVTKQGDKFSNDNISFDQFNHLRTGKYFTMEKTDSTTTPIMLLSVNSDSIIFESGDAPIRQSLPMSSVSTLVYQQDDNGFNAMIGAFAGLVVGGVLAKSIFDFNDNSSSIAGFSIVISGTAAGGLIGYNTVTSLKYSFPLPKTKKP
jgi:hypothetical protein